MVHVTGFLSQKCRLTRLLRQISSTDNAQQYQRKGTAQFGPLTGIAYKHIHNFDGQQRNAVIDEQVRRRVGGHRVGKQHIEGAQNARHHHGNAHLQPKNGCCLRSSGGRLLSTLAAPCPQWAATAAYHGDLEVGVDDEHAGHRVQVVVGQQADAQLLAQQHQYTGSAHHCDERDGQRHTGKSGGQVQ